MSYHCQTTYYIHMKIFTIPLISDHDTWLSFFRFHLIFLVNTKQPHPVPEKQIEGMLVISPPRNLAPKRLATRLRQLNPVKTIAIIKSYFIHICLQIFLLFNIFRKSKYMTYNTYYIRRNACCLSRENNNQQLRMKHWEHCSFQPQCYWLKEMNGKEVVEGIFTHIKRKANKIFIRIEVRNTLFCSRLWNIKNV